MTDNTSKNAAGRGIHAVTPHLVCAGAADAIAFYKQAFGATEMIRLPGPDGKRGDFALTGKMRELARFSSNERTFVA